MQVKCVLQYLCRCLCKQFKKPVFALMNVAVSNTIFIKDVNKKEVKEVLSNIL
jgi:hypothetical protein